MTIYSVIEHILFMSITIGLIVFLISMIGFSIKKIMERRKADENPNSLAEKTRNHLKEKPSRKEKCRRERIKPDDNANNSTFS